jgi:hypothetical protein
MLPTKIGKSSVTSKVSHGHTTVGTSRVQVVAEVSSLTTGLTLRAPGVSDPVPNTVAVWVGGSNVTANSDETTGGFPLLPGAAITFNVEDARHLYFISTAADQDLAWIGV